jgi:hypothetical protein
MFGECHFCHGPVSAFERDGILLDGHGDHEVYMHADCASGYGVLETDPADGERHVTCPECGTAEQQ